MDRFDSHESFRNGLVEDLRRQLLGPVQDDPDEDKQEILSISPLQLYATGVLFPQRLPQDLLEDSKDRESAGNGDSSDGDLSNVNLDDGKSKRGSYVDEGLTSVEREPLNLANEFSPSACGLSFRLLEPENLIVELTYGTYVPTTRSEPHPRAGQSGVDGKPFPATREMVEYRRTHHLHKIPIQVTNQTGALAPIDIEGPDSGFKLHVTVRRRSDGSLVVSVMAVNHKNAGLKPSPSNEDAFFQVSIVVRQREGNRVFVPIDRDIGGSTDDAELASMELLYRHRRAFALGHGVAGDWNRDEALSERGGTDMVRSSSIPLYDLKPIKPRELPFGETRVRTH